MELSNCAKRTPKSLRKTRFNRFIHLLAWKMPSIFVPKQVWWRICNSPVIINFFANLPSHHQFLSGDCLALFCVSAILFLMLMSSSEYLFRAIEVVFEFFIFSDFEFSPWGENWDLTQCTGFNTKVHLKLRI